MTFRQIQVVSRQPEGSGRVPEKKRDALAYALAILFVALATMGRGVVDPVLGDRVPFITFFIAVLGAAAVGGFRQAALAAILSLVIAWYFFVPPRFSFRIGDNGDAAGLLLFAVMSMAIALFSGRLRGAQQRSHAAERRASEQADRLRTTLLSIGDGVITTDEKGNIVGLNPTAESLTGWSIADAAGEPLTRAFQIVNEETLQPVENPVARVFVEGKVVGLANHTVLIARDGTSRPIDDSAAPILDAEGRITGVVLVFRDVSERNRAALVNRQLAAIVESSNDAIIGKNLDGIVTSWNQGAERIFGYLAEEIIGKPISRIIPADRLNEETVILERIGKGERVEHFETMRQRKDGTIIDVSLTISPIRNSAGRIIGASKVARDITESVHYHRERNGLLESERAARTEAERATRLRDEFLAIVSHELRTPLNGILGWAQLLKRGADDRETLTQGINAIEQGAKAQAQLIDDLLDMNRIMTGKLRLDIQEVHMASVIESALAALRPAVEAKSIRLQVTLDPGMTRIKGDPIRLQQVVWNLVSNAVKFTPKGGDIQVMLERLNSHLEISVADNGIGIKPEFLPHVFERFRQADGTTTRQHGGLGLGLAIVKQIVELHGGSVAIESPGEGKGTIVHIRLPVLIAHHPTEHEAEILASRQSGNDIALNGIRVLIVDDDVGALEVLKRMVEGFGAHAVVAA